MEFLASLLAPDFFAAVFRAFVPVCFAALGGLITRRAGILNMALEAMMLWSALLGVIFSGYSKVWFPDLPDVACLLIGYGCRYFGRPSGFQYSGLLLSETEGK